MKILAAVEGFYNVSNIDIVNYITNNPEYVNVYNEDGSLNHDNICTYFEHNIDDILYHVFPKAIGLSEELGFSIFNKSEIINEFNKYMCNKDDNINLTDLLNDVGPTVDEYLSNFKKVILPTFAINQLLELISIYREEHPNEDSVIQYNLDNLEKMLMSAFKADKQ